MKNILKLFGIIALTAIIGFTVTACGGNGGGGDGDLPPAGDGSIDFSSPLTGQVYQGIGIPYSPGTLVDFAYFADWCEDRDSCKEGGTCSGHLTPLSDVFSGTTTVTVSASGWLSMKLGTPKDEYLITDNHSGLSGLSVTSGLKFFSINIFNNSNYNQLCWEKRWEYGHEWEEWIGFIYANKAGTIRGTRDEGGYVDIHNQNLRQGWNTVILKRKFDFDIGDYTHNTHVTGKPGSDFEWVLEY